MPGFVTAGTPALTTSSDPFFLEFLALLALAFLPLMLLLVTFDDLLLFTALAFTGDVFFFETLLLLSPFFAYFLVVALDFETTTGNESCPFSSLLRSFLW